MRTIRVRLGTGLGSDYFGKCDQCGKAMSECFKVVYITKNDPLSNGLVTHSKQDGAYGHHDCLDRFGPFHFEFADKEMPRAKTVAETFSILASKIDGA